MVWLELGALGGWVQAYIACSFVLLAGLALYLGLA